MGVKIFLKLSWLVPHEYQYYDMLTNQAEITLRGAKELKNLISDYDHINGKRKMIKEIEQEGDANARTIFTSLDKSFITPIDREDIASLVVALDEILDYVEGVSDRLVLYKVKRPTEPIKQMVSAILSTSEEVLAIISNLKNKDLVEDTKERCIKIERQEHEMDNLFRSAIGELFESDNPIEIIKLKDMYDRLEDAMDKCADVADIVQAVLLKYS